MSHTEEEEEDSSSSIGEDKVIIIKKSELYKLLKRYIRKAINKIPDC